MLQQSELRESVGNEQRNTLLVSEYDARLGCGATLIHVQITIGTLSVLFGTRRPRTYLPQMQDVVTRTVQQSR